MNRYWIITTTILFLFSLYPVHGQIKVEQSDSFDPRTWKPPSSTVLSRIEDSFGQLSIEVSFSSAKTYYFKFTCLNESCKMHSNLGFNMNGGKIKPLPAIFSFRDIDNDFNNFYKIIIDGFYNTPSVPQRLSVPDGDVILTYKKAQYGTKVRIGYKDFDVTGMQKYMGYHYGDWLSISQIEYLFNE